VARDAVAVAPDDQHEPRLTGERDHACDVCVVRDPDDDRWSAVDPAVEDGPSLIVSDVLRSNHSALTPTLIFGMERSIIA